MDLDPRMELQDYVSIYFELWFQDIMSNVAMI
jgi:hypothetical protein